MADLPKTVTVGNETFVTKDIITVPEVRRAVRKALEAQEYRIGNRSVRRPDLDKIWAILKAAEDEAERMRWDKHAHRRSRQVLLRD